MQRQEIEPAEGKNGTMFDRKVYKKEGIADHKVHRFEDTINLRIQSSGLSCDGAESGSSHNHVVEDTWSCKMS